MKILNNTNSLTLLPILSTFFILTLTWHISYPSNILVFGTLFLMIIFYMKDIFPIEVKTLYLIIAMILIFTTYLFLNISIYEDIHYEYIDSFIRKIGFSFILFIFVLLFYKERISLLFQSIDNALLIIIFLWYLQLILFYVTGEYLDLLEPIAGPDRAQRYGAYFLSSQFPIDIIRPTSIFIEPGTYAVSTFPLLALSYLRENKVTKLHIFLLISYFGSLSLFAIIIATLFILSTQLRVFKPKITSKNILFFILLIIIAFGILQYMNLRFIEEGNTGALDLRGNALEYWKAQNTQGILFGQGNSNMIFGDRATLEDASFIFKIIFEYGVFAIPYIFLLLYLSWGFSTFLLLIIFLTKLHYQVYIIWFYIPALYLILQYRKDNDKN